LAALGAALLHGASVAPTLVTQGCDGGPRTLTIVMPSERMQPKAPVPQRRLPRF
jgi:hypothetical protein